MPQLRAFLAHSATRFMEERRQAVRIGQLVLDVLAAAGGVEDEGAADAAPSGRPLPPGKRAKTTGGGAGTPAAAPSAAATLAMGREVMKCRSQSKHAQRHIRS
jgi:hypothetical protein